MSLPARLESSANAPVRKFPVRGGTSRVIRAIAVGGIAVDGTLGHGRCRGVLRLLHPPQA
jgi:hypothetical protein